jgi:hypothetical protein
MKGTTQTMEGIMRRVLQTGSMAVLSLAAGMLVVSGVPDAFAQQKLSYEQAFARCKADLDRTFPSGSQNTAGRNSRGGACMKQLGFNLKKGTNF